MVQWLINKANGPSWFNAIHDPMMHIIATSFLKMDFLVSEIYSEEQWKDRSLTCLCESFEDRVEVILELFYGIFLLLRFHPVLL